MKKAATNSGLFYLDKRLLDFFPACDHRLDMRSRRVSGRGQIDVGYNKGQHHERPRRMEERDPFQRQELVYPPRLPCSIEQVEPTGKPQQGADEQQYDDVGQAL